MVKGKPAQKPKAVATHRFNKFSVGRAAVLYKRGMSRALVLEHFFRTYAKSWGIRDYFEMYQYLFEKGPGRRPNLAKMFEGKSEGQIRDAFFEWRQKNMKSSGRQSERMRKLHQDPEFQKRHKAQASERMRKLWKDPEWRTRQTELIRVALQRHWDIIHNDLLAEFRGRGLIQTYDFRTEERVAGTTKTPQSEAIERERKTQVEKGIAKLQPEESEAITSTFFEGNDYPTTAENMAITLPELNEILDRAYRKLAKELRDL
ncbi:MAG: hypothetical protein Q8P05_05360 [Candidatus Diapherotrites archaeon]|nr:hypothetical protein [Candidatus Diapherotrites archaeon]